jgi:hypothetical protein
MDKVTLDYALNNYENLIDNLEYINYKYNRQLEPDLKPETYACTSSNWAEMEKRYQQELNHKD